MIDATESASRLDPVAESAQGRLRRFLPDNRATSLLSGDWLGHPVHPVLVQFPIGAWMSSAVLDLLPGQQRAARQLVLFGLGSVPLAVAAGLVEARGLDRRQRRVGLLHALVNTAASLCYAASYRTRRQGGSGRGWAMAGLTAVSMGGLLGGHMAYAQGVGGRRWQRLGERSPVTTTAAADAIASAQRATRARTAERPKATTRP